MLLEASPAAVQKARGSSWAGVSAGVSLGWHGRLWLATIDADMRRLDLGVRQVFSWILYVWRKAKSWASTVGWFGALLLLSLVLAEGFLENRPE